MNASSIKDKIHVLRERINYKPTGGSAADQLRAAFSRTGGTPEEMSSPLVGLTVFLAGLLLALCCCWMAETAIMSRSLAANLQFAERVARRSPSFANAKIEDELGGLTELNPFGADTPEPVSEDASTAYPISSLMLVGTLPNVGAWIRDDAGTHLMLRDQEIKGYRVENISYGKALLSRNGESYPLYLILSGGNTVAPPPPPAPAKTAKSGLDLSAVEPAGPGKEGAVPRELVDKLLMNPYDEIAKMRMTPVEGGGMKLERIAADSVLGTVGVVQGDVIKAINGVNISNMGDAANAINSMMSGSRFDVTVDRGGKPLDLKYQVK